MLCRLSPLGPLAGDIASARIRTYFELFYGQTGKPANW